MKDRRSSTGGKTKAAPSQPVDDPGRISMEEMRTVLTNDNPASRVEISVAVRQDWRELGTGSVHLTHILAVEVDKEMLRSAVNGLVDGVVASLHRGAIELVAKTRKEKAEKAESVALVSEKEG